MQIPTNFKNMMENIMYDKKVKIYEVVEDVDEELNVVLAKGDLKETLKCNVHNTSKEMIQEEYGLNIDSNLMLTCNNTVAKENDIAIYKNKEYKVKAVIEYDSHIKVFLHEI